MSNNSVFLGRSSIKELARTVGLSVSTVSRALNGYADVNAETRQRVRDAAERLNYRPNPMSRRLRHGTPNSIMFLLTSMTEQFVDLFFMSVLTGMNSELQHRGIDLIVSNARSPDEESALLKRVVESGHVSGIAFARTRPQDERIRYLAGTGFPFAVFGRSHVGGDFPVIEIDHGASTRSACERLIAFGHRRIALLNAPSTLSFHFECLQQYRAALDAAGLPIEASWLREGDLSVESGAAAVECWFAASESTPTAIVCSNDAMAIGVMQALKDRGLVVGADVSVIGGDDTAFSGLTSPRLTTFSSPLEDIGARLAAVLMEAVSSGVPTRQEILYTPTLVARDSDGPPRPG